MQEIGFIEASRYLGRGWKLVRQPGLRRFVFVPLVINILIFAGLGWLFYSWITEWLSNWALFDRFEGVWLLGKLQIILQFLIGTVLFFVMGYAFTLLANLIGAPFNSLLAERVEQHLTNATPNTDPSLLFLIKSIPKTLASELTKLLYLALWMAPLLLLNFVPFMNVIAPFLIFVFGAWMFALEYVDYPMGNHGYGFRAIKKSLKQRKRAALGFGFAVAVFSVVPLLNLFIMPIAVAGATALYLEQFREPTS